MCVRCSGNFYSNHFLLVSVVGFSFILFLVSFFRSLTFRFVRLMNSVLAPRIYLLFACFGCFAEEFASDAEISQLRDSFVYIQS